MNNLKILDQTVLPLHLTDKNIKEAVELWFTNKRECTRIYDHISKWDVSNVTNMKELFKCRKDFNEDISKWNVSNVTNMEAIFIYCYNFNQPLNKWDVSNVTNMGAMFSGCIKFNQPLNN